MADSAPQFTAIAAMGRNRVIGKDGKLPWGRIPEDLRFFREKTRFRTCVMGRKTWDSLGKPLPQRMNVVLSSSLTGLPWPHRVFRCIREMAEMPFDFPAFIIGGEQVYRHMLPWTTEILLTVIDQEPEGDTFFPKFESEFGEPEILQAIPGVEWRRYLRKLI